MRVLVACEYSGRVRDAFLATGHHALSCDLLPTDNPGPHYQGDVRHLLDGWEPVMFTSNCDPCECDCYGPTHDGIEYIEKEGVLFGRPENHKNWDLMIAHPDCTYLTNSAAWAYGDGPYHQRVKQGTLVGKERMKARDEALNFVRLLMSAPIEKIAIENPVGVIGTRIKPASQYIQPYEYGDDASKKTGLWLKNLSLLKPTEYVEPRVVNGKRRWANQTDSGQNKLSPSSDRWKERSKTYCGWANAMAEQWGGFY